MDGVESEEVRSSARIKKELTSRMDEIMNTVWLEVLLMAEVSEGRVWG